VKLSIVSIAWSCLVLAPMVVAADWPMFRGPERDGISPETGWMAAPATAPRAIWRAAVGEGFSSITVRSGRVYTMGNADDQDTVWCLDSATGKEIWKHTYPAPRMGQVKPDHPGPRATPTVDGEVVYTISRDGQAFCFDAASGKIRWSASLVKDHGIGLPSWGFASSPLVLGQMLIFNANAGGVALDKDSGRLIWKSDEGEGSYDTPAVFEQDGRRRLAMFNAAEVVCTDSATGQILWRFPWKSPWKTHAADKIIADGRMFVSSAYNYGCALLDVTAIPPKEIWRNKEMRNHFTTSILWKGDLYGFDGNAERGAGLKCINFASGEQRWQAEDFGFGSLMLAEGKLIILSADGQLVIAEASPQSYRELLRAQVLGGRCWTSPVLANGRIYCRNEAGDMVCVELR
jgi:outer membrane protein assembly factor BamB